MKILIVKTSSLGDIIHAFTALSYLRKRYPTAKIDWVVEKPHAELVKAHPQITRVLTIESKKWPKSLFPERHALRECKYDLVFDLQGNLKSALVLIQVRSRVKVGFGWKTVPEWPNILFTSKRIDPPKGKNIREDYLAVVQGYFGDQKPFSAEPVLLSIDEEGQREVDSVAEGAVLVCPGSAWPNKQLSAQMLLKMLRQLNKGPYLFSWGTGEEYAFCHRVAKELPGSVVLERFSLPVLQHVMAKCQLVVAMDSLPLHLCGMTAAPTLSFFGPSLATKYGPMGAQHHSVQGACPYGVKFDKRCPKLRVCLTGACLREGGLEKPISRL